ncbi:MAG: L-fuculose-phosphate aldolase, partial [Eubacteriaceae bacterium]
MLLEKERKDVVRYCRMLIEHGLTKGTGGNISILNAERGLFAISPSGIDYFETEPEDVVVMDLDGKIVDGNRKPSSEHELHRIFYANRGDIGAVVHTHSVYSTVLGTLREGLPASSYLVAFAGPDVRCAEYASYGSPELARNAFESMRDRKAVILANHGLVAGGPDILNAFNIAEQIEGCAEVYVKARSIGKPVILDEAEMNRMVDSF